MKKVRERLSEINQAMASLFAEENPSQKTVHASRGQKVCRGIDCKNEFVPKRRNQVFCSSKCRLSYFGTAREIGTFLLEERNCNPRLRNFINKLLRGNDGKTAED